MPAMSIWQQRMVARAASWVAGLTPAQQEASTAMGTSGKLAFSSRALLTTQMSVHRPMRVRVKASPAAASFTSSGSRVLPKVGFYTTVWARPDRASTTRASSCQPAVSRMQWGTGSFRPSEVFM